jgi:hypothetical protein
MPSATAQSGAGRNRVMDGTDTFVFAEDGQIRVQTVKYTPQARAELR